MMWKSCLGNLFEHYDTALFGFLSPFLATVIFPEEDPITALIFTYAMIPLGMIARPIGSLFFGAIGDSRGRGYALFLTLGGMGIVSSLMAFIPSGFLAPFLFFLGKALQNFFAAGETMGGAITLLENSQEKKHDLLSGFYGASAMGGHILASLAVYGIGYYNVINPGWRFCYLFGGITAFFGCLLRKSPSVKRAKTNFKIWTHKNALFSIIIASGFANATYSIALVLMNGFIPLVTTYTKTEIMKVNTYLLVLDFLLLPIFGWVAQKIAREKVMMISALSAALLSIPLLTSLQGASLPLIIGIRIIFVLLGVSFFAPFHAWAQKLLPEEGRYRVISLGYALGSQVLGSPTAALSLWCFQKTGSLVSLGAYWIVLALASALTISLSRDSLPLGRKLALPSSGPRV